MLSALFLRSVLPHEWDTSALLCGIAGFWHDVVFEGGRYFCSTLVFAVRCYAFICSSRGSLSRIGAIRLTAYACGVELCRVRQFAVLIRCHTASAAAVYLLSCE